MKKIYKTILIICLVTLIIPISIQAGWFDWLQMLSSEPVSQEEQIGATICSVRQGCTGQNSSAWTGIAQIDSGTWSADNDLSITSLIVSTSTVTGDLTVQGVLLLDSLATGALDMGGHRIYSIGSASSTFTEEGGLIVNSSSTFTGYITAEGGFTGNASTTTAFLTNPTDCANNQFAHEIDTFGNLACLALVDDDIPNTITASNYLLLTGGTLTGDLTIDTNATTTGNFSAGGTLLVNSENGNVGIGTTTPAYTLDVWGDLAVGTTTDSDIFWVSSGEQQITAGVDMSMGSIQIDEDSGAVVLVNLPVSDTPSAGTVQSYDFQIDASSTLTVYSEADGSGGIQSQRVGIATSTPTYTLSVDGDLYITGAGDDIVVGDFYMHRHLAPSLATLGPTAPTPTTIGTSRGLAFDSNNELAFLKIHISDSWNSSTDMILNVGWCPEDGNPLSDQETVAWVIEYRVVGEGGAIDAGTEAVVFATTTQSGAGTDKNHYKTPITIDWDDANQPLMKSHSIFIKFYRNFDGDTYAGDAVVQGWGIKWLANRLIK